MKKHAIFAAILSLTPVLPLAPAVAEDAQTPAVATPDSSNPTAPVPGKNSFTEDQARQRIADAGYTNIDGLKLDDQGFWTAKATKSEMQVQVMMDYQGNVVAK